MEEKERIETHNDENVCLVCGDLLTKLDRPIEMVCAFCGKIEPSDIVCVDNHFVCSDCQHLDAKEIVRTICLKSTKTDPIEIAREIMASPAIKMHGPEHHFLTPAVLLTAVANYTNEREGLAEKIELAEKIAEETAPVCSWHLGTCGAALGASIFLILWRNLDLNDPDSWDRSNSIVTNSLKRIAQYGSPRCCKRDTYIALEETIEYLKTEFGLELPTSEGKCIFSLRNRTCKREDCIYFNLKFELV